MTNERGEPGVEPQVGPWLQVVMAATVMAILAGSLFLFGVSTTALSGLILGTAVAAFGSRTSRMTTAVTGGALGVASLIVIGLCVPASLMFGVGPVSSPRDWPSGVQAIVRATGTSHRDVKVECLVDFMNSEHVCRLELPTEKLAAAVESCGMTERKTADAPPEFWQAFRLWRLKRVSDGRYFSTRDFPADTRGQDGEHAYAMYSPRERALYVWYKSNF